MSKRQLFFAAAMLASLAIAAAFRFPRLDLRPMHADEANQAVKTGRLYETGEYEYDTTDHHGPSLYWLTLPSLAFSGTKDLASSSEVEYRIVPALFGLSIIGLLLLMTDGLGLTAVAAGALLTAISPAMVYYSRYYIQEMLLVFFTLAAIGSGWRYALSGRVGWILAAGAAVGMMHATKETWILSAASAAAAGGITWLLTRQRSRPRACPCYIVPSLHVAAAAAVACFVAAALFSMFGKNWPAAWDSIRAYANYFRRGSERGEHSEPWYYYLQILFAYRPSKQFFWSEGLIAVLAVIGIADSLLAVTRRRGGSSSLGAFLAFYTVILLVLYSAISYKTPWCALSILMGLILLAGIGVAAIFRAIRLGLGSFNLSPPVWMFNALLALLVVYALVIATGRLARQAYRLNFDPRLVADPRNPYVYAHTPMRLPRLGEMLERLRQQMPQGRDLTIHVVVKENYWPLPWYLRKFKPDEVYYWLDPAAWQRDLAHLPPPEVLILSADEDSPGLLARLQGYNGQEIESLRPGVFVRIFVRNELWPAFLSASTDRK